MSLRCHANVPFLCFPVECSVDLGSFPLSASHVSLSILDTQSCWRSLCPAQSLARMAHALSTRQAQTHSPGGPACCLHGTFHMPVSGFSGSPQSQGSQWISQDSRDFLPVCSSPRHRGCICQGLGGPVSAFLPPEDMMPTVSVG